MTTHFWDPVSTDGSSAQEVSYDTVRVGNAGELIFSAASDPLDNPEFIVAPGEWKVAWREDS